MAHYNLAEWQGYRDNRIGEKQRILMEEHLYSCDACLDIYLQTIDSTELEQANAMLPKDFIKRISNSIGTPEKISKDKKTKAKNSTTENARLLIYYTAAASIAVFFTFNGFLDAFINKIPANIGGLPVLETREDSKIFGRWSLDLMEKTIGWVDVLIENEEVIGE